MKGITSLIKAIQRSYDKLCCIMANIATTNTILASAATEATQLNVLAAVDMMRDYETRLVVDNSDITWLEVRYWDTQDGTLGAPVYYPPGSTVAGTPDTGGSGLTYINPNTFLSTISSDTTALNTPIVTSKSILRVTVAGLGSVAAGKRRVSFYNAAKPDANVDGIVIKRGEVFTFVADGMRDTLDSFSYDCLTSELVITTVG